MEELEEEVVEEESIDDGSDGKTDRFRSPSPASSLTVSQFSSDASASIFFSFSFKPSFVLIFSVSSPAVSASVVGEEMGEGTPLSIPLSPSLHSVESIAPASDKFIVFFFGVSYVIS